MSDIEDTANKLRRNLLAVSAAILAAYWLQLPVPSLLASIFNVGGFDDSSAPRMWAAGGMLVLYLLGRFHFSDDKTELASNLKIDHGRLIESHMVRQAKRNAVASRNKEIAAREKAARNADTAAGHAGRSRKSMRRFGLNNLSFEHTARRGTETLFYRVKWTDDDPIEYQHRYSHHPNEEDSEWDSYYPSRLQRVVTLTRSFVRSAVWSRGTFDIIVPYALSLAALCACGARFFGWA